MSDLITAAKQALEALAIGKDAAYEVAQNYHEAMAGYRPARHIAVDDDVRKIEDAITALRAALAEPVQEPNLPRCPKCGGPADNGHDRCVPPTPYFCTKCMAEPVAWTDADADAARLAMELEALLLSCKDTAALSRWWDSAHDALDLHRERLRAALAEPEDDALTAAYMLGRYGWRRCSK